MAFNVYLIFMFENMFSGRNEKVIENKKLPTIQRGRSFFTCF